MCIRDSTFYVRPAKLAGHPSRGYLGSMMAAGARGAFSARRVLSARAGIHAAAPPLAVRRKTS
eukprot:9465175-Alexandrium_andersonii.AAC.1